MSVWTERDLPVLSAVATPGDGPLRDGYLAVGHGHGREALGVELDDAEIHDSLLTLGEAGYLVYELSYESGPSATFTHLAITGAGLQALGEWPLFDAAASPETVALLLEYLAPEAPSEEEGENMRRAATYLRTLAPAAFRSFVAAAIATTVRQHLGF